MAIQRSKYTIIKFMGIILCLALAVITICCSRNAYVIIDGSVEHQTMDGWGINHFIEWDWEGPDKRYPIHESNVMKQIKTDLSIDYVHVYQGGFYEEENDDNDPFNYNWRNYNSYFQKHRIVFERLKHMQEAGISFVLKGGNQKPAWMVDTDGDFDSSIPKVFDELSEYWTAFMIYAKDNYDLSVPYIVIQQEPSWHINCNFSATELRDAIKAVGTRLRKEGFSTMILAPDDSNAESSLKMCQTILLDDAARNYISNIAYHGYDGTSHVNGPDSAVPNFKKLANDTIVKNSGLSIWMTEWVLWYNKRMRDYVDTLTFALDFAKMVYNSQVYANASNFVIWSTTYDWGYDKDGNGIMENEGIFGPGVTDGKLNLKKYGHTLSQYTKYIPPGSKRIDASLSGASNVFATAYKNMKTGIFTIVFINKNASTINLNVDVKDIPGLTNLKVIRTSSTENSAELGTIALSDSSFTTALRDSSVTTFTGNIKIP